MKTLALVFFNNNLKQYNMKKTIYAVYALICVFALCGEYSTENMNEFFLYYSFWFINAVIATVKFNKTQN